jgi:hypothetical protein
MYVQFVALFPHLTSQKQHIARINPNRLVNIVHYFLLFISGIINTQINIRIIACRVFIESLYTSFINASSCVIC